MSDLMEQRVADMGFVIKESQLLGELDSSFLGDADAEAAAASVKAKAPIR